MQVLRSKRRLFYRNERKLKKAHLQKMCFFCLIKLLFAFQPLQQKVSTQVFTLCVKISRLSRCLASGHRSESRICELDSLRFALRKRNPKREWTSKTKSTSCEVLFVLEVPPRFELGNKGFADLCLTAWPWHRLYALIL